MLIGFLPVFMFFLGTLQVADTSIAHLVVEHAATAAARAAVVVLPDDGAYYDDEENAHVDEFFEARQSDVERAADTILRANPRLDGSFANVSLGKPQDSAKYQEREIVTANVTAPYHCLVAVFCPGGLTIAASAQLVYQGAHYIYEPSTGWASNAINHGIDNIKKKVGEYREKKQDEQQNGKKPGDEAKPDDLRKALPPKLRDVPIEIDPSLAGSTVQVHYTHDDKGRITGIEVHAGPDATARHIQDHVPTIKTMQRYQGVAGKARALAQRFKSWLTGNPNAGPGTLAWETHREVEKLTGIIESRAKQLEDPNLTDAQRSELESELTAYEKQLAQHEKRLDEITNEPGRGYVAANSAGLTAREEAEARLKNEGRLEGPVPDAPPGYHWTFDPNGRPIVARDRIEETDGKTRAPREFDPKAKPDANDPFAQFPIQDAKVDPPKYKTGSDAISGKFPPTQRVKDQAAERQKVADDKAAAKRQMDGLAKELGLDKQAIAKKEGADIIQQEIANAQANQATQRVQRLQALAQAQSNFKENERKLAEESEKLGSAMTEDYMAEKHSDYTRTYPEERDEYERGKPGEFDYVYTKGEPPSVIIVEAKGAGGDLTSARGKSQGTPDYVRDTARLMVAKDPEHAEMWQAIAEGDTDDPHYPADLRYIHVQAPVDGSGKATAGKVREFDLSESPETEIGSDAEMDP